MKSLRLGSGDRICPDARYLAANKPLKIIINTIYQYVIMLSLGRQDSPAPRPPPPAFPAMCVFCIPVPVPGPVRHAVLLISSGAASLPDNSHFETHPTPSVHFCFQLFTWYPFCKSFSLIYIDRMGVGGTVPSTLHMPAFKPSITLSLFFSYSCALFCTTKKLNPFLFKQFLTLYPKTPGVGEGPC